jgi:hypothetical protein
MILKARLLILLTVMRLDGVIINHFRLMKTLLPHKLLTTLLPKLTNPLKQKQRRAVIVSAIE